MKEENKKLQAQLKNSVRARDEMKERLKLQEEVADAALKEVDHTIAFNASKIDISPSKVATSEEVKERKSMPLW